MPLRSAWIFPSGFPSAFYKGTLLWMVMLSVFDLPSLLKSFMMTKLMILFAGDGLGWNPHRWYHNRCLTQDGTCSSPDHKPNIWIPSNSVTLACRWHMCSGSQFVPADPTSRNANTSAYRNVFTKFVDIMHEGEERDTERESIPWGTPILPVCVCARVSQ